MELRELVRRNHVEEIREELAKIADAHPEKMVTAENVVDAAAHPDSPLHRDFQWDDTTAGHQYRLLQARALIRKVRVVPSNSDNADAKSVPKYVSLMSDRKKEGGGYRSTESVIEDADLLKELESTAKDELAAWTRRHAALTELCQKVARAAGIPTPKRRRRR